MYSTNVPRLLLLLLTFAAISLTHPAYGQTDQGRLGGVVSDANGAIVQGASIIVKNAMALIAKDSRMGTLQEMAESTELFRSPEKNMSSVPVNVGHIYLLRITDPSDKTFELLAKLIVVGHVPNESVTMRWQILPNLYVTKN